MTMYAPQLDLDWTIVPNLRKSTAGGDIELAGWYALNNRDTLVSAGWDLWWTSDGTAGPADADDHTDRLLTIADWATRSASLTAPQSYFVVKSPVDGVHLLFTYFGSSDLHVRVSYSYTGFTLAGTTTHAPTAADEIVICTLSLVVDSSGGFDNVMTVWATDTHWRAAVFRNNGILRYLTFGKHERLAHPDRLPLPYCGSKFVSADRAANGTINSDNAIMRPTSGDVNYAAGPQYQLNTFGIHGYMLRVVNPANPGGVNIRAQGGAVVGQGTATWNSSMLVMGNQYPGSLGGATALTWPIIVWGEAQGASIVPNVDGPWVRLIDWWQVMTQSTSNPSITTSSVGYEPGDTPGVTTPRVNWLIALGAGVLWPWKNVAPAMEIA